MPTGKSIRRYIDQSLRPIKEFGQEQHRQPCGIVESARLDRAFLVERELFAQEQDFSRQGGLGAGHQRKEAQRLPQKIVAYIEEPEDRLESWHALGESHARSVKARRIVRLAVEITTIPKPLIHLNHTA